MYTTIQYLWSVRFIFYFSFFFFFFINLLLDAFIWLKKKTCKNGNIVKYYNLKTAFILIKFKM